VGERVRAEPDAKGVPSASLAGVIAGARGGSMRSNPIVLTDAELETILRESMGPLPVQAS